MEPYIPITWLNDFIFCPYSIYLHTVYDALDVHAYHSNAQQKGRQAHQNIDASCYSTKKADVVGIDVYNDYYGISGKIDLYHSDQKLLVERKRKIKTIYDGYRYQLYAQYFCLKEMGYSVESLCFHSLVDNKRYFIEIPQGQWLKKFELTLQKLKQYDPKDPLSDINPKKCQFCIYRHLCDKTLID